MTTTIVFNGKSPYSDNHSINRDAEIPESSHETVAGGVMYVNGKRVGTIVGDTVTVSRAVNGVRSRHEAIELPISKRISFYLEPEARPETVGPRRLQAMRADLKKRSKSAKRSKR